MWFKVPPDTAALCVSALRLLADEHERVSDAAAIVRAPTAVARLETDRGIALELIDVFEARRHDDLFFIVESRGRVLSDALRGWSERHPRALEVAHALERALCPPDYISLPLVTSAALSDESVLVDLPMRRPSRPS
jgi:hypothetical protein